MSASKNTQNLDFRNIQTIGLAFNCSKNSNILINKAGTLKSYDIDLQGIKVIYAIVLNYNDLKNNSKLTIEAFSYKLIDSKGNEGHEIFTNDLYLNVDPTVNKIRILPFVGLKDRADEQLGVIQLNMTFTHPNFEYKGTIV